MNLWVILLALPSLGTKALPAVLKSELQSTHFCPVSLWAKPSHSLFQSHFQGILYLFSSQPKILCASCRSLVRSKSNHVSSLPKNHSCRLRQKQITRFYFKIIAHLPLEGWFRINRLKKNLPPSFNLSFLFLPSPPLHKCFSTGDQTWVLIHTRQAQLTELHP